MQTIAANQGRQGRQIIRYTLPFVIYMYLTYPMLTAYWN